jgi:hypothetical protein
MTDRKAKAKADSPAGMTSRKAKTKADSLRE